MDIRVVSAEDGDLVADLAAFHRGCIDADSPWQPHPTRRQLTGQLRHGWDGDAPTWLAGLEAGEVVADGSLWRSTWDNPGFGWLDVQVRPDARRAGRGSALLAALVTHALADGRRTIALEAWESPVAQAFATHHGYALEQVEVCRRLTLGQPIDYPAIRDEAARAAAGYEVVRIAGSVPEDLLEPVGRAVAAINDAPTDGLDFEAETFPPARLRAYEAAQASLGNRVYRVLARHTGSGEICGNTVLAVDSERPHLGEQHDTSVVTAHRGHRLGLLLKADMLAWMAEDEPQLRQIDTGNAETNGHMIAVNDQLGFRPLARRSYFQRRY